MSRKPFSSVSGYSFPQDLSDNKNFVRANKLGLIARAKFYAKVALETASANKRLKDTLRLKVCYYGPFKGEFGHLLAHTVPFLMYLHSKGVKIVYCGMEIHAPFLVDEQGKSIVSEFVPLRDFFSEVAPDSNSCIPPPDVQAEIKKFEQRALTAGHPYWNIGDDFYYWFVHRHWLGKGHTHLYDLSKVYQTKNENAVCIFPRGKGASVTHNNGGPWDYEEMIEKLSTIFEKIYIVGHPSQSLKLKGNEKTEFRITADNKQILEACSNSKLIITQHSGVNNLGEYLRKQVLIIYNGGKSVSDIGSMNNTLYFRQMLNEKIKLRFAFSMDEIVNEAKNSVSEKNSK